MVNTSSPLYAVVDLGSNSFHLLIVRDVLGSVQTLAKIKQKVRLASGLTANNTLTDEAMERGWQCLACFAERLQDMPPAQVRVVATAALRQATNASVFIKKAEQILGHTIQLISGEEEASTIYHGVASTSTGTGRRLVIDIGGASTEMIIGEEKHALVFDSLKMGCVTWRARYFVDDTLSPTQFHDAIQAAKDTLNPLIPRYLQTGWQTCLGASGTIQTLKDIMLKQGLGEIITRDKLLRLRQQVEQAQHLSTLTIDGLSIESAPVFPSGLAILIAIFESFEIESMHLANGALREGVVYQLIATNNTIDVKQRQIINLQHRFHIDVDQAKLVAKTAHEMFTQCDKNWIPEPHALFLLETACQLHEIGLSIQYKRDTEHAHYVLKNSNLIGFSTEEQCVIAELVARYRRKCQRLPKNSLLSERSTLRLCVILRLAVIFCHRRKAQAVISFQLVTKDDTLYVNLSDSEHEKHPLIRQLLTQESEIFPFFRLM